MTGSAAELVLRGTWTALATPFTHGDDLPVDWEALDRLVDRQVAAGVDVLVPCGTTGESPTLSHEEHDRVVARVTERSAGRVPVVAGTGSNSTAEAVRLTRNAERAGAAGALVVSPYYNRPTQRMLVEHFVAVAAAVSIPVVLYDIPSRTGVDLLPETVAAIAARAPNVRAVKAAAGCLDRVARIRELTDLAILSGDDALTLPTISAGGVGVISVASNVAPDQVTAAVRTALGGDLAAARAEHLRLLPFFRALFTEVNPVPVKAALEMLGLCGAAVRPPLLPAIEATRDRLRSEMARIGLISG